MLGRTREKGINELFFASSSVWHNSVINTDSLISISSLIMNYYSSFTGLFITNKLSLSSSKQTSRDLFSQKKVTKFLFFIEFRLTPKAKKVLHSKKAVDEKVLMERTTINETFLIDPVP